MNLLWRSLAAALILFEGGVAMSQEPDAWPELPTTGFVTGRAATPEDVEKGDAVFSMNGVGKPATLAVPQYVYWRDDAGKRHLRVLVQAENAPNGIVIVGLRDAAGRDEAATADELDLLGTRKPE